MNGSEYAGWKYKATSKKIRGLLPVGSKGVNHGALAVFIIVSEVSTHGNVCLVCRQSFVDIKIDGVVTLLKVKVVKKGNEDYDSDSSDDDD